LFLPHGSELPPNAYGRVGCKHLTFARETHWFEKESSDGPDAIGFGAGHSTSFLNRERGEG